MAGLKEIRTRIESVKSTRQITSAMKMVSAAKLRRAQDAIIQISPYADKLSEILSHLSSGVNIEEENVYAQKRELNHVLLIAITSNRGLCGSFNSHVVKKVIQLAEEEYKDLLAEGRVKFLSIGKKATELLKSKNYEVIDDYSYIFDKLTFPEIVPLAETIMQCFLDERYDRIDIVYNHFKNAAVQHLTHEQFLPVKPEEIQKSEESEEATSFKSDYIFEPTKEYIVEVLIPKSLKIQFYKILLDSHAAEHGARMTAMHKATDNATELIRDLRLSYNKARQNSITNEIIEIVSGAEALKG